MKQATFLTLLIVSLGKPQDCLCSVRQAKKKTYPNTIKHKVAIFILLALGIGGYMLYDNKEERHRRYGAYGFDEQGIHKKTKTKWDERWFDCYGKHKYTRTNRDFMGMDRDNYDEEGLDILGCPKPKYDENGNPVDDDSEGETKQETGERDDEEKIEQVGLPSYLDTIVLD